MTWKKGQALQNGKYIIQEVLGGGGFGVTYRAMQQRDGKPVAIKTLSPLRQERPEFPKLQEKFVQEAFRLAKCSHPHIVEVYDVFQETELWAMVMEYIDGKDLWFYIDEGGIFSEEKALTIISQVGEALTCVHQQGFLHRDVKPHNIVLRPQAREAVLIDFGLARDYIHGRTMSQTNYRTECFASIEQYSLKGKSGPFTDVYALAATLYYLLTQQKPFPAEVRKQNVPLIPPQQHNSQISDRINQAILQGMELYPEDRPQSVAELLQLMFPPTAIIQIPTFTIEVLRVDLQGEMINGRRQEAEYFVEDLGNGVILEMVSILGGSFMMGSPKTEKGRDYDESPQHQVTVAPFYMGKYPITQDQWQAVANLPPVKENLNPNPSYFKGGNRPVECITWYDGVEFCARLSRETGRDYRLPSEAEWEYACRAGTTTPFHFGETITSDLANYDGNIIYRSEPKGVCRQQTTDVGIFPPNAFGLYDMHGNVWEWCADIFHKNYRGAPSDGSAWLSGEDDSLRLLRGCSWHLNSRDCRCAYRYCNEPGYRYGNIGLRVACVSRGRTP